MKIVVHHSNYRQYLTKIPDRRFDPVSSRNLELRNILKSTKNLRLPILSKCVRDKLNQDAWLPLPHGPFLF